MGVILSMKSSVDVRFVPDAMGWKGSSTTKCEEGN